MNKNKKILLVLVILLLTSCTSQEFTPDPADVAIAMANTEAAQTATAQVPRATRESTPAPSPTPSYSTSGMVSTPTLNLRAGPGTIFQILDSHPEGAAVLVVGRTPNGDWVMVKADASDGSGEEIEGWMYASLLRITGDIDRLPEITLYEKYAIRGRVTDDKDNPINSVRVSAIYYSLSADPIWGDDTTNDEGEFTIYLPPSMSGPFDVQIVEVYCDSLIVTEECIVIDYFTVHYREEVTLPHEKDLHFTYEKGVTHLEGRVTYKDGWGIPNILVRATRQEDGVDSETVTPSNGRFILPLGLGTWDIIVIRFEEDGNPLIKEVATITVTEEGQVIEPLTIITP